MKKQTDFWIYGWHAVVHALCNSQRRGSHLWVLKSRWSDLQKDVPKKVIDNHRLSLVSDVSQPPFSRWKKDIVHQGVALNTKPLPLGHLDALTATPQTWVVALDQIEDPQNWGHMIRTAAAWGVSAMIVTDRHTPPLSPTVMKVASGGVEHLNIIRVSNLAQALRQLKKKGFWIVGLAEDGEPLHLTQDTPPAVFVLGNEGRGLRNLTKTLCDQNARLSTSPAFPTLNVASSLASVCYAWVHRTKS